MALAPHHLDLPLAPDAKAVEEARLALIAEVEHAIDTYIQNADRSKPQAVPMPVRREHVYGANPRAPGALGVVEKPVLDEAGEEEIVRRYLAAGWATVAIKDGVLHLGPVAVEG